MKVMEVNKRKIILMYFAGFMIAMIIPKKYFVQIMSEFYNKINQKNIIIENEKYYKLI
jgi:hypothetical protein